MFMFAMGFDIVSFLSIFRHNFEIFRQFDVIVSILLHVLYITIYPNSLLFYIISCVQMQILHQITIHSRQTNSENHMRLLWAKA